MLRSRVFGCNFDNPIGLAAGFDKDARAWRTFGKLGWGFVEVGGVTPRAQPGSPRPRLFRLSGRAVVNRMGFNSCGVEPVRIRLSRRVDPTPPPLLVNLGVNRDTVDPAEDWEVVLRALYGLAEGFTLNISSPNTAGLRSLEDRRHLRNSIERLVLLRRELAGPDPGPALLVKLSPDPEESALRRTACICVEAGADGIIATNTSAALRQELAVPPASEGGGLSGAPLGARAEKTLRVIHEETEGSVPLIGVGGISTAEDAYARIRMGASLVQLYTAMIWEGVGLGPRIADRLAMLLARDGFRSLGEAVGVDSRRA